MIQIGRKIAVSPRQGLDKIYSNQSERIVQLSDENFIITPLNYAT